MSVKKTSFMLLASLFVLAACGESAATPVPATGGNTAPAAGGTTINLDTASGVEFKYAQPTLEAAAGQVTLTLNNPSVQPHNWTLVKVGEEDKANTEGNTAGAPNYAAASAIAQTKTINGGQKDTITFTATPGTYSYICTFPGHLGGGMKGTMTVK